MKTVILVLTILVSNVCMADLASQLASAIDESSQEKTTSQSNLQVDIGSVKAAFVKLDAATTLKDPKAAFLEEAPTTLVSGDEEVVDDGLKETIAQEVQEARSLAQKNK